MACPFTSTVPPVLMVIGELTPSITMPSRVRCTFRCWSSKIATSPCLRALRRYRRSATVMTTVWFRSPERDAANASLSINGSLVKPYGSMCSTLSLASEDKSSSWSVRIGLLPSAPVTRPRLKSAQMRSPRSLRFMLFSPLSLSSLTLMSELVRSVA